MPQHSIRWQEPRRENVTNTPVQRARQKLAWVRDWNWDLWLTLIRNVHSVHRAISVDLWRMESADSDNDEGVPIVRNRMKISKGFCKETLSYKTFRTHTCRFYDVAQSVWHEEVIEGFDFYPSCSPPPLSPLQSMNESTPTVHNDASPPSLHHHDIGQFSGPESESSSRSSLSSSSGMLVSPFMPHYVIFHTPNSFNCCNVYRYGREQDLE